MQGIISIHWECGWQRNPCLMPNTHLENCRNIDNVFYLNTLGKKNRANGSIKFPSLIIGLMVWLKNGPHAIHFEGFV